jgi:hypothetical protein
MESEKEKYYCASCGDSESMKHLRKFSRKRKCPDIPKESLEYCQT